MGWRDGVRRKSMTDKSILVWLRPYVGVEREAAITSRCREVMVFLLKYVVPSASPFSVTVIR
jgi:hypothetical protein